MDFLTSPLRAPWRVVVAAPLLAACAATSSLPFEPDPSAPPGADADSTRVVPDAGRVPLTAEPVGCRGPLRREAMSYDAAWGRPIASFARRAEEHVFFDSCRMIRLDRAGEVLGQHVVCDGLVNLGVAEDDDGYWLAGAKELASSGHRTAYELVLSRLDAEGRPILSRPLRTGGAFETTTLAVSPTHVAITTIMASHVPYRGVLLVDKSAYASGSEELAAPLSSDAWSVFGPDRLRWTARGFEGFFRVKGAGRRAVVSTAGELVVDEPAPFYALSEGACDQSSLTYFPRNTVFSDDDARFVALEPPPGSCPNVGTAPIGTRFTVVARSASSPTPARLAELVRAEDGPHDAKLCLTSSEEATLVSVHGQGSVAIARVPYSGQAEASYETTVVGKYPRALCPVPIVGGYLLSTVASDEADPLRVVLGLERLVCR